MVIAFKVTATCLLIFTTCAIVDRNRDAHEIVAVVGTLAFAGTLVGMIMAIWAI